MSVRKKKVKEIIIIKSRYPESKIKVKEASHKVKIIER